MLKGLENLLIHYKDEIAIHPSNNNIISSITLSPKKNFDSYQEIVQLLTNTDKQKIIYNHKFISALLNIKNVIEYIPIAKYTAQIIIVPFGENYLPESAKDISYLSYLDNEAVLFISHLTAGVTAALLTPKAITNLALLSSVSSSIAFGIKLATSNYLSEHREKLITEGKSIDVAESLKHCAVTLFAYTVPSFAVWGMTQMIIPGSNYAEFDLWPKLSLAGAECYYTYKVAQEPIISAAADKAVPYIADGIAAVASYANGYSSMTIVASVITTDWITKLALDLTPLEVKENYIDPALNIIERTYLNTYEFVGQLIENCQGYIYNQQEL